MMAAKKQVEIEKLLRWAYIDELSKRVTSSAEGIWDRIEDFGQRGGIDPGHGAAQRYPHFGLPHPDAEKIELAVSSLQNLIVDWKMSCVAIMGDLAMLFKARDAIMVGTLRTAALVTMHAKMSSRPDWQTEQPIPHWVGAERGRNRPKLVGECLSKDRYTAGAHHPLTWEPSPISIAQTRADYACWHRGLVILSETLELQEHVALPPVAPSMPWNGEREPERHIFGVGDRLHPRQQPLPLKPQRETARAAPRRKTPGDVKSLLT
jgi:hypothetical protein